MHRHLAILLLLALASLSDASPSPALQTYRGAWFEVQYPEGFTIQPREPGATTEGAEPDGVSFLSPDGIVEFYVYSPQWRGASQWIVKRPGEKTLAYSKQKGPHRVDTYVTLQGPDYQRSYAAYHDTEADSNWVFGYQYPDKAAYDRYRPLYLKFKQSLVQFAD